MMMKVVIPAPISIGINSSGYPETVLSKIHSGFLLVQERQTDEDSSEVDFRSTCFENPSP